MTDQVTNPESPGLGEDSMLRQLQRRHRARGLAARRPLVMEKPIDAIAQDVRGKLLKLGHPTYKRLWEFAGKPRGNVDASLFHGILHKLGLRTTVADARTILCALCGGAAALPFHRFCQLIAQDQVQTWDEMRNGVTSTVKRSKFTPGIDGGTKRLRPDLRDGVLRERQSGAAEAFNTDEINSRGIEAAAAYGTGDLPCLAPRKALQCLGI